MTWATERLDVLIKGNAVLPPVVQTMRLEALHEWGPGWARKRWRAPPEMLNVDGSMFGGTIAALADQMLAFAAMTVVPNEMMFRTINLQVQFFHLTRGEALSIEGRVIAQTKTTISAEAEFRSGDTLVAKANAVQVIRPLHAARG